MAAVFIEIEWICIWHSPYECNWIWQSLHKTPNLLLQLQSQIPIHGNSVHHENTQTLTCLNRTNPFSVHKSLTYERSQLSEIREIHRDLSIQVIFKRFPSRVEIGYVDQKHCFHTLGLDLNGEYHTVRLNLFPPLNHVLFRRPPLRVIEIPNPAWTHAATTHHARTEECALNSVKTFDESTAPALHYTLGDSAKTRSLLKHFAQSTPNTASVHNQVCIRYSFQTK